jgi:uncharacterized protein (TIGR03382 family)
MRFPLVKTKTMRTKTMRTKTMKTTMSLTGVLIGLLAGVSNAAVISWGAVSVFDDYTDVNKFGLSVTVAAGANWAGTVNGVTFTDQQPGTLSGFDFDYYAVGAFMNDTGSSPEADAFDALVGATSYDAVTTTISLSGLTVGQAYRIQAIMVDDRSGNYTAAYPLGDLDGGTPSAPIARGNTGLKTEGNTIYGNFTADADGIQEFTVIGTQTMLTGYVLTTTPIPEPSAALLGGLGLLALLRRRR